MGYSWVDKGLADGLSFTYGNDVYTYDAGTNTLDYVSGSKGIRRKDLLFVVNDLSKVEIVNNSFKIYVNYYYTK